MKDPISATWSQKAQENNPCCEYMFAYACDCTARHIFTCMEKRWRVSNANIRGKFTLVLYTVIITFSEGLKLCKRST